MVIENSPTSLDPRIGVDNFSENIGSLIFDSLVHKNAHFTVDPWLATSWETPDPLTYRFHLRTDVHFQNGKPLTATDVKYTLDSMRDGTVITAKAGALARIDHVDAPDAATVVIHLKQPDAALLWNLSDGAIGIVPAGSGRDFAFHPMGSGPFRFVSQMQDNDVVIERSDNSWHPRPAIARIRFAVVPDAITRALELEKGSADVCINCLTADMVSALAKRRNLEVEDGPGTNLNYISFNTQDSVLRDLRVRQAIAYAMNRPLIISSLWRNRARLAESLLPPEHWAWTGDVRQYPYDPAKANALLDAGGWKRGSDGVRFHLTMKTSTDETSRLLAMILQQQLRDVGIALEVRSFEFATFFSDISKGAFQMYTLRWAGRKRRSRYLPLRLRQPHVSAPRGQPRPLCQHGAGRIDQAGCDIERPGAAPHRLCKGAADSRCRIAVDQSVVSGRGAGTHQAPAEHPYFQLRQLRFSTVRNGDTVTPSSSYNHISLEHFSHPLSSRDDKGRIGS